MVDRATKLRWRRHFRRRKRQVEDLGVNAEENLERLFFKRLSRLLEVRRFVFAWILLVVVLIGGLLIQIRSLSPYYQTLKPTAGGVYTEGQIGSFTNANPLYATSSVDSTVSRLLFSGLLKYDNSNQLVGDLAEGYSVDEKGTLYTVILKENVFWHDGRPLVADDVLFTYGVIQNPDAKSPLATSWQGVKVAVVDKRTVTFTLPNALSAFPYSMTNGIVPKHLLDSYPMAQLRSIGFNTINPVGTGPFKWEAIEVNGATIEDREQSISLVPYQRYHFGSPKIQRFVVRSFIDETRLLNSFKNRQLDAVVGLEQKPDEFKDDISIQEYNIPLTSAVFAFFRNSHEVLSDTKVRRALTLAVNTKELIRGIGYPVVPVTEPLLNSHVGYNKELSQLSQNVEEANKLLEEAGWKKQENGIRQKDGKPLSFRLYTQSTSEYQYVSQVLQNQWRAVGAEVEVLLQPDSDLQTTIGIHSYDVLLYGISLGVDPDVFPYWHSSQAEVLSRSRLNLSEYKSKVADRALEAGRTRSDPQLRTIKYKPFLEAWRADAPAIALYQPRFLYVTHDRIFGFEPTTFNIGTDRFTNVQDWMVRQVKANK